MSEPILAGMLAYGMSGKIFHAPFLAASPFFSLKAVVERNKKLAKNDYPEITSFDSIDALLADSTIELVVINTPNYLHYEHSKAALLAGKHILVEKPFTPTEVEAKEIFDLGRKLGLRVMVYQNRRYSSDFLATKKIIHSGRLGGIIEAHFRFDRFRTSIGPKIFKEQPYPASGILYDLGSHLLDQAISVFGVPESFHKTKGSYRLGSEVDDFGHIHLKYSGQKNVFITVSMLAAATVPGIVINGTKGSFVKAFSDRQEEQLIEGITPDAFEFGLEAPSREGELTTIDANGGRSYEKIASEKGNMMEIFESAYHTIRENADFIVREEEILAQLNILEA